MKGISRHSVALAAVLAALSTQALAQDRAVTLSIAPKPVGKALQELAAKTGANILFTPEAVAGVQSMPVRATVTAEQGARRMLTGTGLEVIRDPSGALLVRPRIARSARIGLARPTESRAAPVRYAALQLETAQEAPAAAAPAPAAPEPLAEQGGETAAGGVQDIIVTAQKRSQNLQDVPISITALTADAMQANRIINVRDLNAVAPNLTVRTAAGGLGGPSYSMRGIVSSASAPGSDKGISLYIDNVYIGPTLGSLMDLADIERIEVLKGPQGTLFGRNSTGGAISIITRDPPGRFGLKQDFTYGNYDQLRSKTRIDLPSFGPLSVSATYTHSERRGDIRNLGAGTVWDFSASSGGRKPVRTSPKYLGDQNVEAVNVAAKLDLSPLTLVYKFDWSENHFTADGQAPVFINTAGLGPALGGTIAALLASQPDPSILSPITAKRPKAVNNAFTTPGYLRNQGHNLTARLQLNDQISIKNILAFRKSYVNSTTQLDGLGGLVNTVSPLLGPIGAPYILLGTNSTQRERQWSNEFQLNIHTEAFELTAGYLHFDDHVSLLSDGIQFITVPNHVFPARGTLPSVVNVVSNAVFAQGEFHIVPRLELVLGTRLTWDRKYGDDNTIRGTTTGFRYSADKPTWLAGLNYQTDRGLLLYAKYSTGFISGGYLATLNYAPETAESWEGGVKADWFDRRLRTNLSVFHATYGGMQFITLGANFGVPAAQQIIVNGGDGRANGFEFEGTAVPIHGLTLQANLGYTDFKYTKVNPLVGNIATFRPIFRPKWTSSLSAQYETGEIALGGHLVLRADANYQSKTYTSFLPLTPAQLDATTTGNIWIVNGRIALADIGLMGSKAQVALWGRNLTNNRALSFGSAIAFIHPTSYERARTYGVDLSFEF